MSDESQSERIWRYVMQADEETLDVRSTSAEPVPDRQDKQDDTSNDSTDLSNSFRPPAFKLQFHGLAESQSQTPVALDASDILSEPILKDLEHADPSSVTSHYSNRPEQRTPPTEDIPGILEKPSFNKPGTTGLTALPALENGHVTGASAPRGGKPIIGRVVDVETKTAPLLDLGQIKENGHKRLLQRNKALSFHVRPQEPSLSPPLKRLNTMPPRLNRYAPRDIEPSSQDSFAGSPPRQDLNTFLKNSKVLNSLYIRPGVAGQPSEVFELASNESSQMPPPPRNRKAVTTLSKAMGKRPENPEESKVGEEETPSQLLQAALEHGLIGPPSPPSRALLPIILAKDTQSDHQQSEDDANESKNPSSDDMAVQSEAQSESLAIGHSPANSSSSFILPKTKAMNDSESPQPTQVLSLDIPSDMIIVSPHGVTLNSVGDSGLSSIPIPEHRKLQFYQHFRNRSEIVPATPISTVAPSGAGTSLPQLSTAKLDDVHGSHIQSSKYKENDKTGQIAHARQDMNKPISKPEGPRQSERVSAGQSSKNNKGLETILPGTEIVPDSQEGNNSGTSQESAAKPKPAVAPSGEVVPDSQESDKEKKLPQHVNPLSSPYVPLAENYAAPSIASTSSSSPSIPLLQTVDKTVASRFPTPTPAAVRSPLRKGLLPDGVTHTRGRGRPSTKGKAPAKPVAEDVEMSGDEDQSPVEDTEDVEVDENLVSDAPLEEREHEPVAKKRTRKPSSKAKAMAQKPRKQKQKQRGKIPTRVLSRKRKSDPEVEQQQKDETDEVLIPPLKRTRSSMTAPVGTMELDPRVLAKRQDDDDYFYSGTAHIEFAYPDATYGPSVVRFDDGYEEPVDFDDIRLLRLEPGDLIEVVKSKRSGRQSLYNRVRVLDTDRWQDEEVAEVHDDEAGPDGDDYDVNGRNIRVGEEQIRLQWNERCINLRTLCKDKEFELPRRNKYLVGYAFIVTLPDRPKSKSSLQRVIELSGGVVCEWNSILSLSGTSEVDGNRVVGKSSDVRLLKNRPKAKNLFCIADEPCTTPKFLIALALGVPCLSVDWVRSKVADSETKFDWQAYILPAGTNPVTKMAASQNFDRMWWHNNEYTQLLSQPPVFKLFAGMSFLCLGSSFILKSKEFGTYPKVLLAMGASVVQAVTDLKFLNAKSQMKFDYTVVDDDTELVSYNDSLGVNILWIKKCLITGIRGPVPWPE